MLPEHAPFSPDQRRAVEIVLAGLDVSQRFWLAGFLSAGTAAASAPAVSAVAPVKLTVLYGTESGNAEKLADLSVKTAKKRGFQATAKNMSDIAPADLAKFENLLVVVSTWGDGEPPESATAFYKEFMNGAVPSLKKLRYSVCALGDTAYEKFCQTGKDIDARLESLGGTRILDRQDCDVEFDEPHAAWLDAALKAFGPAEAGGAAAVFGTSAVAPVAAEFGKKNPFPSELLEKVLLNGKGTSKETWHYELSLEGSGITYEPGDALAVIPVNAPDMVEGILRASKLSGAEEVEVKGVGGKLLADALREDFDITALSRAVLTKLQALSGSSQLAALLADDAKDRLKDYQWGRWIADAIADFAPDGLAAADLATIFRKLPPRLYSIASSPLAHPGEVHLTVASVRYQAHGQSKKGVASTYLSDLVAQGGQVPVYTHQNKNFRLPSASDAPVIMVGPGTGVAPFRAFVEHRAALGHGGKNWLFFGDQRYTYDFLYQTEWQEHLKDGNLSRLDVAFSRDQPEKVYVQHRMLERAKELYGWLQEGAHFYVCGDASRMAHDVHEALVSVVEQQGGFSRELAEAYVEDLKKSKRYQRDVY
ncbi:MAG: sulfite reductase [NADPH] flavoprotein alpha-component [Verrucomicrobia bacterium]|nr:MAG: sulfite reductase [NADPH] flavoprotein alpha-component [Verrucomicrobiota bacterium]TAE86615.1 MAG: sulfite reductase [NADPH] flavoprotein alpha-component [Verrucomicrobiota bacterium]TAF24308.1 MAG: sulfite reductase [NADPH] flavoprotein alpha-component [Verrucomicrobiota bacterium]TAF40362.1 MAG: sulfite reductase [NADPH] flavoprotein alpha-component [Verrucomicrobiota bacterium]